MTSTFSTVKNFSIKDILDEIYRISTLNWLMHDLNDDFSFPRENRKCNINVNFTKLNDITDELIEETVTKALSDVLSDSAELRSTVEEEVSDIKIMPIKKSDGKKEVNSDDEAEIDDGILTLKIRTRT
ncbi:hypothetical protein JTB14_038243 [Gonioctena quinquepunctata]|nr:hypothetical protein JTB14_038243 [Gonioctena quinquepunctata]